MAQRRLFYLDEHLLSAYRWQAGKLTAEDSFTADSYGLESFAAYLAKHAQSIYYLLVDVVEEGFQFDVVPHVQGSDRSALLKRKLDQYFFGTPLSLALPLGREKEGRRDDKILFAALTRPQHFEPWLAALRSAECQLAGVFSLPLILDAYAGTRGRSAANQPSQFLIITLTRAGLRQSFFDSGKLRFSRLTPLTTDNLDEIAGACAVESVRIYQYLIGYRLIARGAALPTRVLVHPSQIARFRARCADSSELNFEFLDLLAEARRLRLKTLPEDSNSEALFLHLTVRVTPRQQFAAPSERRLFRLWQTRLALNSSGLAILLACVIFSARQMIQVSQLRDNTEQAQQQAALAGQQYAAALKTLPKMPFSGNGLRALIDAYDTLVKRTATLEPVYQRISAGLQQAPRVELERIDWKVGGNADEKQPAPGIAAMPPATAGIAGGKDLFVIVDVYAQLPVALKNDERTLKNIIDAFSTNLSKDGKVQIHILKLPFDVESTKSLKSTDEDSAVVEAPKFSLRIVQKL